MVCLPPEILKKIKVRNGDHVNTMIFYNMIVITRADVDFGEVMFKLNKIDKDKNTKEIEEVIINNLINNLNKLMGFNATNMKELEDNLKKTKPFIKIC